jgi:hypothetical protein
MSKIVRCNHADICLYGSSDIVPTEPNEGTGRICGHETPHEHNGNCGGLHDIRCNQMKLMIGDIFMESEEVLKYMETSNGRCLEVEQ